MPEKLDPHDALEVPKTIRKGVHFLRLEMSLPNLKLSQGNMNMDSHIAKASLLHKFVSYYCNATTEVYGGPVKSCSRVNL